MLRVHLIVLLFLFIAGPLFSQRTELGFGVGTFNYTGDLVRTYKIKYSKPAVTVLYRSNMSKVVSFRASITGGKLAATEEPIDAFAKARNASFDIFLLEASLGFEYHFLNWRDDKRPMRYSPYIFAGMALFGISGNDTKPAEYSNVQVAIPFGVGFKYIMNPKWYAAFEIGVRKTFFDYLDNVSDTNDHTRKNYQSGNPNDFDNYFFVGLTFTRTFYNIPCPRNPYK